MENTTQIIRVKAMAIVLGASGVLTEVGEDMVTSEKFGRLLGGKLEFRELAEDALRREFREELGSELENVKLLGVLENLFNYNGMSGHNIVFLYQADLADKSLYQQTEIKILDTGNSAAWVPLPDITTGRIKIYPAGALDMLMKIDLL